MSPSGDVLERFLEALVEQISATRPEYLTGPFAIAEIYQDLVPYRSHRNLIGVEMNGDYEDALFRLLSGEGDYLVLDSEVARREIQAELARPNPNTGLYRDFAAVDVRLHPSRVPAGAGIGSNVRGEDPEADVEPELETVVEADEVSDEPSDEPVAEIPDKADAVGLTHPEPERASEDGVVGHIETASDPPLASVGAAEPDEPAAVAGESDDVVTVCHWCREDLPERGSLHFCPFCGSDLRPSPCRECGEAMEARWQFCASCGADVRA